MSKTMLTQPTKTSGIRVSLHPHTNFAHFLFLVNCTHHSVHLVANSNKRLNKFALHYAAVGTVSRITLKVKLNSNACLCAAKAFTKSFSELKTLSNFHILSVVSNLCTFRSTGTSLIEFQRVNFAISIEPITSS